MYYVAECWLVPTLSALLFDKLNAQSGRALKLLNPELSNLSLQKTYNRALPRTMSNYYTSLSVFKLMNTKTPTFEHNALVSNIMSNSRSPTERSARRQSFRKFTQLTGQFITYYIYAFRLLVICSRIHICIS